MSELKQRFEELSQGGPPHVPLGDRLSAGHRALRRRRIAVGISTTLAFVVVAGATVWNISEDDRRPRQGMEYADDPTDTPSADVTVPVAVGEELAEHSGEGVFYDEQTGQLQREESAIVTRLVTDPTPTDAMKSVALDVTFDGERRWMYLHWSPDGGATSYDLADEDTTFDSWLTTLGAGTFQNNLAWQSAS